MQYEAKNGSTYSGWVVTNRLIFTGAFGGNMSPESVELYKEAARKAKAGRLGSPFENDVHTGP